MISTRSMLQVHVIAELGGDNTKVRDKYELQGGKEGVLGEGLCGTVVSATHKKTGRKYACKVLKLNRIDTARLEELRREIRIMMRLDHPNIVKLYEVFEEQDRMCECVFFAACLPRPSLNNKRFIKLA